MATVDELVVLIKADSAKFEKELSSIKSSLSGLESSSGKSLKNIDSQFKSLTGTVGAFAVALGAAAIGAGFKKILDAGKDLEKAQLGLAGLINATTQFSDAQGKALNPIDNLNASVGQANKLYDELRQQALLLADIETPELLAMSTIALPKLSVIGITEASEQAALIGTITASIKQLGIATSEIEAKKELEAFLSGDVTGQGVEFAKLVAQVNGGTEAFKANYAQAVQNGQAYEFLTQSLSAFRASGELSATTLSNQFSVLNDSVNYVASTMGTALLPSAKELVQVGIDQFFTKGADGAVRFNAELKGTAQEIGENFGNAIKSLEPLVKPTFDLIIASLRLVSAAFGETGQAGGDSITQLAGFIQGAADTVNFLADRVGGLAQVFVGVFDIARGVAVAGMGAIVQVVQNAVNAIIAIINGIAKAFTSVFNFVASGINKLGGSVQTIDFKIPKLDLVNKLGLDQGSILKALKAGAKNIQKGLPKAFAGIKSSRLPANFFSVGVGGGVQGFNPTSKAVPDLAGGGSNGKGGKGKSGGGQKEKDDKEAAREAERQKREAEAQRIKNEGLKLELGYKQAIRALEAGKDKQTQGLESKKTANEDKIKELQLENQIAQAKAQRGQLSKEEADEIERANNAQITQLQNENALIPLQIQKINNANQLAQAEVNRNNAINQATLDLQNGKTTQQEYTIKVQEAVEAYAAAKNELLGIKANIDQAIVSQTNLNTKTSELANVSLQAPVEKIKECGKTGQDVFGQLGQTVSGLGNALTGAFENGKFNVEKFGESALQILGQVISQIAQIGLNSLFGGMGGGGGGGIFSSLFGGIGGFASGGFVSGGGTSTSDSIPAMLSNGEFVVNASATKQYGALLHAINTGRFTGFADGGYVSAKPSMGTIPTPSMQPGNSKQVMISINAVDSQSVIDALSKKDVRRHLFDTSNNAVQKSSNRAFNRSTMEFARGR